MTQPRDVAHDSDSNRPRDPEDRPTAPGDKLEQREKMHDKTLADSFPTSDPPSTIPDPAEGGEAA